jgi:2-oxoglutarate ferredoxin oxidoreductase subunit beta
VQAVEQSRVDQKSLAVVSGIGCTGRVAGYLNVDSFHTTHGRAIPFAAGLKLANPKLKVVVYSGEGDIVAIGGNHFIHAARRNMELIVICVNNHIYGMTGGQVTPTTPYGAVVTTAPYGNYEPTFNLPYLAESVGATYVARWTTFHVRRLAKSIREALDHKGFSFIEVLSPCPTLYMRRNRLGDGLTQMQYYKEKSEIKNETPTSELDLGFQDKIIVGKFVEKDKPSFIQSMNEFYSEKLGPKYTKYEG